MAVLSRVASTPSLFADGSPLPALRRSAAVAAAGLTVWVALLCSSASSSSKKEAQTLPVNVPEWTMQRSIGADPNVSAQMKPNPACDVD